MRLWATELVLAAVVLSVVAAAPFAQQRTAQRSPRRHSASASQSKPVEGRTPADKSSPTLPCGDILSFQILMDRQGFSPGQIDGEAGDNFRHALVALQSARSLTASGEADCDTWHALGGDTAGQLFAQYTITEDDARGPYQRSIPRDMLQQAELEELGYVSMLERLGERFHAAPSVLQRANSGIRMEAGATISVPAVLPFDPTAKPKPDPAAGDVSIVVARDDSALRVSRADGTIVFFAPVTTGSEHDPLPSGDWTVRGVQWWPPFHYNPDLFWDAKPEHTKATIKPGPNNPVGVVWIALSLEHYGIHGTPEPGQIGHTESHGCVRLTNWDAARVASLVKPGTPVQFR